MSIESCIREFVNNKDEYSLYDDYSNEYMAGENCLGVIVRQGNSFMDFLCRLTAYFDEHGVEDSECELEGVSYDGMGSDIIVYFPNLKEACDKDGIKLSSAKSFL